jgi:Cu-processing system ATP-binding protein
VITFRDVVKQFGRHRALDGLSLTIGRGEVIALLGPNGSGKTTTLKLAAGLIGPDSGQVAVGDPPASPASPAARRAISFLPQRAAFPEALTGSEVVDFYARLRAVPKGRTKSVLQFASLNGAGERAVSTYSGGMLQRLGLAVAMLEDVDALLLDEPTAALDPDGLCAFYGLIEQRRALGRTILFTSHQVGDAERLADRFLVLAHGRLVAELTQTELRDRLAARGVIRIRMNDCPPGVLAAVRAVSPKALYAAGELIAPGPARLRPVVLDIVREQGFEIRGLVAEDGRLEALYRELVAAAEDCARAV